MAQVFISYSSRNDQIAEDLHRRLTRAGVSTFLASESLRPGDLWKDTILDELRRSKVVMVIMSPDSVGSQAVMHEIGGSLFHGKKIIPILYKTTIDAIPEWIRDRQAISYNSIDEGQLEELVNQLIGTDPFRRLIALGAILYFAKIILSPRDAQKPEKSKLLREKICALVAIVGSLRDNFPNKKFTLDGRLVGDIGETIAELEYDLVTFKKLRKGYDAVTSDGRPVQIKATFKDRLTFKNTEGYLLGFKIDYDGSYSEVYNGPAKHILMRYNSNRAGIGQKLLSFPVSALRETTTGIRERDKVSRRR